MLATLSSHLGRFFAHADELLQECQSYGESMRGSLEAHLGKLNSTVAEAMDEAGKRAAEQLDDNIERAIGDRLHALRQELDDLGRLAEQSAAQLRSVAQDAGGPGRLARSATLPAPARARAGLGLVGLLLVAANLMLAALLVVGILRQDGGSSQGPGHGAANSETGAAAAARGPEGAAQASGDAPGTPGTLRPEAGTVPALGPLCERLAAEQDPDAARAFVAAAAAASCDERAGAATANVLQALTATTETPAAAPVRGRRSRAVRRR